MGNIILGGLLVLMLSAISFYLIKQRKKGGSGCPHCNACKGNSKCGDNNKTNK